MASGVCLRTCEVVPRLSKPGDEGRGGICINWCPSVRAFVNRLVVQGRCPVDES
jgi:hypothetical protein